MGEGRMKNLISLFLAFSFLAEPFALAAATGPKVPAPKADTHVQQVDGFYRQITYDLDHVDDVIKDLDYITDDVATKNISKRVMIEVARRLTGAARLTRDILLDDKIPEKQRAEWLGNLNEGLDTALSKLLRYQKEDRLDDSRLDQYGNHPDVAPLVKKLENKNLSDDDRSDLQDEIVAKLDQLQKKGVPPTMHANENFLISMFLRPILTFGGRLVVEEKDDFFAVFWPRMDALMRPVWTALSRSNQNTLAQNALRDVVGIMTQGIAKMNSNDPMQKKMQNFWAQNLSRYARVRSERLTAQRVMYGTYFTIGIIAFWQNPYDFISYMAGEMSNFTAIESNLSLLAIFGVIGTLKANSTSGKTLNMIAAAQEILKDPKNAPQKDLNEVQKLTFYQSVFAKMGFKKYKCDNLLTEKN